MIRTWHDRRLKFSRNYPNPIVVRHLFEDEPATLETWDRNAETLARECNMSLLEVHAALALPFAELYPIPR